MAYRLPLSSPPSSAIGYSHFSRPAYLPVRYGFIDWMAPVAAYSPSTGFHCVNTSGGSPAEISDWSFASPVALGMLDSVTWMVGWVRLNAVTIWLSSVRVAPDHMVCQVMSATFDDDLVGLDGEVPPQPARASTAAVASSAVDLPAMPRLPRIREAAPSRERLAIRFLCIFSATRFSFALVCIGAFAHVRHSLIPAFVLHILDQQMFLLLCGYLCPRGVTGDVWPTGRDARARGPRSPAQWAPAGATAGARGPAVGPGRAGAGQRRPGRVR